MSDTPTTRTDAEAYEPNGSGEWVVGVPFARNLERELAAANERIRRLIVWGNELNDYVSDPPDRNCSCHICPPCCDCVDWAGLREIKQNWKEATDGKP